MTEQQQISASQAATMLLNMAQESCGEALKLFEPLPDMDETAAAELAEMARSDKARSVVLALAGITQALASLSLQLQELNSIAVALLQVQQASFKMNADLLRKAQGGGIVGANGVPL